MTSNDDRPEGGDLVYVPELPAFTEDELQILINPPGPTEFLRKMFKEHRPHKSTESEQ